jgi:hypothetical protein
VATKASTPETTTNAAALNQKPKKPPKRKAPTSSSKNNEIGVPLKRVTIDPSLIKCPISHQSNQKRMEGLLNITWDNLIPPRQLLYNDHLISVYSFRHGLAESVIKEAASIFCRDLLFTDKSIEEILKGGKDIEVEGYE